jgi:polyphosphate kinase
VSNWRKLQTRTTSDGKRRVNPFIPARSAPVTVTREVASPNGETIDLPPLPPELFINRELSWLEFNCRVLDEAADAQLPLLERVKFAAIFASNLDEFFMIRVANVKRKLAAGLADPGPDGRTPAALALILKSSTQALLDEHARLFREDLAPKLAEAGVELVRLRDVGPDESARLGAYFEHDIFPVLTPQAIDRARRFPHVSNQSLNLLIVLQAPDTGVRYARLKIPAILPRLIPVPGTDRDAETQRFVWLEDLVASRLSRLFPGHEIVTSYPFHVCRDADIEIDEEEDEARDLLVAMEKHLSQRTFGAVVQLLVDASMPEEVRVWLMDQLHASDRDLYVVDGRLALEGLFDLVRIDRPDLKFPALVPAPLFRPDDPDSESTAWGSADIFAAIRERDILIHHPYQSFGIVTDFLKAAARDSNVVAIKQTLYRIGRDSPLIPALVEARDEDTQVAVLMEVKARFDEENNILWAHELEHHGVHVAYGLAGLKTHCKVMLVVRRDPDGVCRYVHLSTGNYNATTARMYEDVALLTASDDLGSDISELFNVLTGYSKQEQYRKIWVAPMHLREQFLAHIAREIASHREQGGGRLIFKMNSLVDRDVIRMLYAASQAGVEIDLIVRGVCCLRPGVPGWSEHIRVRSLVGRFLEHSRIYYFGNGGADEVYIGSADIMERNFDRRVEVVFPIEDELLKAQLRDVILPAYFKDTVNARCLNSDGTYSPVEPAPGEEPFDVQRWLIDYYRLA